MTGGSAYLSYGSSGWQQISGFAGGKGLIDTIVCRGYDRHMPHKDPEARRQYLEDWRKRKLKSARDILCGCGCGGSLKEWNANGVTLRFIFGHGKKKPEGHVPQRVLTAKQILCGCGCGNTLPNYNKFGNKQRYIYGHVATRIYEPAKPPLMAALSENKDAQRSRASRWAKKLAVLRHLQRRDRAFLRVL
jgi:hypothetical protein